MKNLLYISLLLLVLTSCEETVKLDLDQTSTRIVVEGAVTDVPNRQFVKVSESLGFYQTGVTPRITNAVVKIQDDLGHVYNFTHNPSGKEETKGIYLPVPDFTGVVGRTYTLTVLLNGITYSAQDKMFRVTPIDSINFKVNDRQKDDPKVAGRIYEINMWAREPQETKDFYLFKFYRNDTLTLNSPSDIYVADDEILGEKIDGLSSPVYYSMKDTARFEMYSLSRNAYIYYSDFSNLLNSDGGMFSPQPANPRSNISNGALGIFQVSAISSKGLILK